MNQIPRGVRNNNPGNIDHHPEVKWQGELPYDPKIETRFCRFQTPQYGIRAMAKILLNYWEKLQINTIRAIIHRWAPPSENATDAYIKAVSDRVKFPADQSLDMTNQQTICGLVAAIMVHENGFLPYAPEVIREGVAMAFV